MFTIASAAIDFVFDVLFSVAKKLVGLAFFMFIIALSIVTTIVLAYINYS